MKLIIDIDDELVETARFAVQIDMGSDYVKSIANGTPLDNLRAEIVDTLYVDSLIFGELIDFKNGDIADHR